MKLCSHHKKRPGESCTCMNQWLSVAACLCCFLMDRYDGNSYLYPGLSRLGIHHLASILSAYASAKTKQVCHICCMDVCAALQCCASNSEKWFKRVIQITQINVRYQATILCMRCGCIAGISSPILFPWIFVCLLPGTQYSWHSPSHRLTHWQGTSFSPL